MAQKVKNLPAVRETWVQSLGWEDPLEKGTATTPVSGLENSMDCIGHGVAESDTTEQLSHLHIDLVKERKNLYLYFLTFFTPTSTNR